MRKREQTVQEKALAERMRLAWEKEYAYKLPKPKTVSQFRKETLRINQNRNV